MVNVIHFNVYGEYLMQGYEEDRDSVTTMGTIGMSTRGSMMNMSMSSLQSSPGKRNKIQMEMPVFEGPSQ